MFEKEDSNEKKLAIVSKLTDSIRILAYFGHLAENLERFDRIKGFLFKAAKDAKLVVFITNFILLVKDPLTLMGFCFKLYHYESLINTVDELYQQLQLLLEQKGNITEFINKEAIQLRAKSIFENRKLKEVDKKVALFRLIEKLDAVNEWRV